MINKLLKIINRLWSSPFSIPYIVLAKCICKIRSSYYTRKIDSGGGQIIITDPFLSFQLNKHKTSHLKIIGNFMVSPHLGGNSRAVLSMGMNSHLTVNGDFLIGNGVKIFLAADSTLRFGGQDKESGSGITADTMIMVNKSIDIGKDFLCAWNVFITDSDWHQIEGDQHQADVVIADHVWIANSNNVLKGTNIGAGSIVASNSKVGNKSFPSNVLIGGTPGRILKSNINWSRDI